MLATKDLMNEHQFILKYIDLMERYANHSNKAIFFEKMSSFIAFIHEFADDFHHAKEEDILFRYLAAPEVLTHCNPIPQMLHEHNKARELVRNMENALTRNKVTELVIAMTEYANLLKEHIYKENNILYPMAERGLSDTAKVSLLNDYAITDTRMDSEHIWQRYEILYTELVNSLG
jgi:hemerythrin-like domain-containing protein